MDLERDINAQSLPGSGLDIVACFRIKLDFADRGRYQFWTNRS
jgi:hypothetical protein